VEPASDNPLSPETLVAVAAIDPLLGSADSVVRRVAVGALASLRVVTMRFVERLGDPDDVVVRATAMSLECQAHALPFLEAHLQAGDRGRVGAFAIMIDLRRRHGGLEPARALLASLLDDRDPSVAEAAAHALAELCDARALLPLARLASGSEQAGPIVAHILEIVGRTDVEIPRETLEVLARLECRPQVAIEEEDRGGHFPHLTFLPAPAIDLGPLREGVARRLVGS